MKDSVYKEKLLLHGSDILASANMQLEKQFMQHGNVSVFDHSVAVACTCIWLADRLRIRVDERAGAGARCSTIIFSTTGMCRIRATDGTASSTPEKRLPTRPGILPLGKSSAT